MQRRRKRANILRLGQRRQKKLRVPTVSFFDGSDYFAFEMSSSELNKKKNIKIEDCAVFVHVQRIVSSAAPVWRNFMKCQKKLDQLHITAEKMAKNGRGIIFVVFFLFILKKYMSDDAGNGRRIKIFFSLSLLFINPSVILFSRNGWCWRIYISSLFGFFFYYI